MDIANIFCQFLSVTSHTKRFLTVCRFWTDLVSVWTAWGIRSKKIVVLSNGLRYSFEKNCHPFERLGISVWKNCYLFERLRLSIRKRINFVDHSSDWSYLFKDKFSPSFHPKTISSLANCVERSVFLQVMYVTKFVYKRIIYGSLLHCSHLRLHIINSLSTVSTYVLFST